jgi:predicted O-methyltransferase YrrM
MGTPTNRNDWLIEVHRQAEELLAGPDYGQRFSRFLREDQIGKWRLDKVSGYYWLLHALVSVTRPKKVIELGRCLGTSALFMLGALSENAMLITVDIEERASDLAHCALDPRLKGSDIFAQAMAAAVLGP